MARRIIEPPRLQIGAGEERRVTWLELFADLIFAVAVAQVARRLEVAITLVGTAEFLLLFVPVWWAWAGDTYYTDRFGIDDLIDRLSVLVQMGAAAVLAVTVADAFGAGSVGFALAYAAFRFVLVAEYLRARWFVPEARALTTRYASGFGVGAAIWAVSALVPPPGRFVLWGIGTATEFATPVSVRRLHVRFAPHRAHLPERFGLFTLIVLGESIGAVVAGLSAHEWNFPGAATAMLGLVLAFGFWWLYFENLDASAIRAAAEQRRVGIYQLWLYAHLPLTAGLTAAAVGVEHAIIAAPEVALPDSDRWLVCGASAVCFAALGVIHFTRAAAGSERCTLRQARMRGLAAVAAIAIGALGTRLPSPGILALLAALGVFVVGFDLRSRTGG